MRIDKFLKVSRILKRRTVAASACGGGRVIVNGREAKAGAQLKIGDIVSVKFGEEALTFKVLKLSETVRKDDAEDMYEIITSN